MSDDVSSNDSGCGCIVIIILAILLVRSCDTAKDLTLIERRVTVLEAERK